MAVKAYKRKLLFSSSPTKYYAFIKKHMLSLNPNYYSVASKKQVDTKDGIMYCLRLTTELSDPNLEPLIEVFINMMLVYLWRDKCWVSAVDACGRRIVKFDDGSKFAANSVFDTMPSEPHTGKVIIVHEIGDPPEGES